MLRTTSPQLAWYREGVSGKVKTVAQLNIPNHLQHALTDTMKWPPRYHKERTPPLHHVAMPGKVVLGL